MLAQFEKKFFLMDKNLKNKMPNNKKKHIETALDSNSNFKWSNDLPVDLLKTPSNFKTVAEFSNEVSNTDKLHKNKEIHREMVKI